MIVKFLYSSDLNFLNENTKSRAESRAEKLICNNLPDDLKPYANTCIGVLIDKNPNYMIPLGLDEASLKKYYNTELKKYIRIKIEKEFDIYDDKGPSKYIDGIFRIVITELNYLSYPDTNNILTFKNDVMYIYNSSQDESDFDAVNMDKDFNGLSFKAIHSMFKNKIKERNNMLRNNIMSSFTDINQSNYNVIPIHNQSECIPYNQYTEWCITREDIGRANYNSYTSGGRRFYFFLRKDYKTTPCVTDENTPLDSYGLSMISFLVDMDGNFSYITTRWNHKHNGEYSNPDTETVKMFQNIIGMNLYEVCKPYTRDELHAMGIILFDEVPELLASGKSLEEIFDRVRTDNGYSIVRLNGKCNIVNSDRKLLLDNWYYYIDFFKNGFAQVRREEDGLYNFIDEEGNLISDNWYRDIYNFENGFAQVRRKEDGLWNFIDKEGNLISDNWYRNVWNFENGFAKVQRDKDGLYNFINEKGNLISNNWYHDVRDFENGFAKVQREDRNWIRIDKKGKEYKERIINK